MTGAAAVRTSAVRIGSLFPDLLGTYGDRGNAMVLADRLHRRSIDCEVVTVLAGAAVPGALDCYVLGGGEDHTQRVAAQYLHDSPFVESWRHGAAIVAICAGFQLLGTHLELGNGDSMAGLGLVEARTAPGAVRRVGDTVLDCSDARIGAVSGFENHRGVTTVAPSCPPLGHDRRDRAPEGVLHDRILATYLHGPVLARNPLLADVVLEWIAGPLPAIADEVYAPRLHATLVSRFGTTTRRSRGWRARAR